MADAFKVLVWEGEQSFLVCVFVWVQEGGRGERNGGQFLNYPPVGSPSH
jgi:hypothetical protein